MTLATAMEQSYLNTSQTFQTTNLAEKNALIQKVVTILGFGRKIHLLVKGFADYGKHVALVTKRSSRIRFTN